MIFFCTIQEVWREKWTILIAVFSSSKIKVEEIISNPGLQHLAEIDFWNLYVGYLNRKNWIKVIQSVRNSDKELLSFHIYNGK